MLARNLAPKSVPDASSTNTEEANKRGTSQVEERRFKPKEPITYQIAAAESDLCIE